MVYIRKLLFFIRKTNSKLNEKQKILSFIGWILLIGLGVVIDLFVPFNYFTNILRSGIALAISLYTFSLVYILTLNRIEKLSNTEAISYVPLKERFSYKQRVNISVVLWGALLIFALLGSKENPFFTAYSSLIITFAFGILTFVRSTRDETQSTGIGFEDPRDILFEKMKQEELERRRQEELESKKTSE